MQSVKCEITWRDLELKTAEGKQIIKDACGQISPGTMSAIMGPSGSGKTTLLDCISGRISKNLILKGDILVNGFERDAEVWPKIVAYVGQTFASYEWQTVAETFAFVAAIKHPNQKHKEEKVDALVKLLGLGSSRNTFIGDLSGGERIRVSLGIEILGDPPIILLDEPISGLDSYNALNILKTVRRIADTDRTVLLTIHQPSYKMMSYFDKIILMCEGAPVFDGSVDDCVEFFGGCGFKLPKKTNPTDFFLDVLALENENKETEVESRRRIDTVKEQWKSIAGIKEPELRQRVHIERQNVASAGIKDLSWRSFSNLCRNRSYLYARMFQRVVIGCLFGLSFLRLGVSGANAFSFRGAILFFIQNELFGCSGPILNLFDDEKKVIFRERMSGFYNGYQAFFSKAMTEACLNFAFSIPFTLVMYYLLGFDPNFGEFVIFMIIILCVVLFAISFGLAVSVSAPSAESAQIIGITISIAFILFSGALAVPSSIPSWLRWLVWLSPIYYAFSALCQTQLSRSSGSSGSSDQDILDSFETNRLSITANVFVILGYAILLQIIGSTVLHYKTRNNLRVSKMHESSV